MKLFQELNRDQLDGLAKLAFDLAKGSFFATLLPASNIPNNPIVEAIKIITGLVSGLAFTYFALVLLKIKEEIQK